MGDIKANEGRSSCIVSKEQLNKNLKMNAPLLHTSMSQWVEWNTKNLESETINSLQSENKFLLDEN